MNVQVIGLLVIVTCVYAQSQAALFRSSINYGTGTPGTVTKTSGIILTNTESTSLLTVDITVGDNDVARVPAAAATMVGSVKAVGFGSSSLFLGVGANVEFFTSIMSWFGSGLKVVVGSSTQLQFWTSVPGVSSIQVLSTSTFTIPADTNVLILDYSLLSPWSASQMASASSLTSTFLSNPAARGLIIGGDSSYYAWTDYYSCLEYPANKILAPHGIQFICDYWATRSNTLRTAITIKEQENVYFALKYLNDFGRPFGNSDFASSVFMAEPAFYYVTRALASNCGGCALENRFNPEPTTFSLLWPMIDAIFDRNACSITLPITRSTEIAETYCASLVAFVVEYPVLATDVPAAPSAQQFPGLSSTVSAANMVNDWVVDIDTYHCGLISTGAWALPGEEFTITIPVAYVNTFEVQVGLWNGNIRKFTSWERVFQPLKSLRLLPTTTTIIATGFGGPIYLNIPCNYFETLPSLHLTTSIELDGVVPMLLFVQDNTTLSEWNTQLATRPAPWAEIESEHNLFLVPRSSLVAFGYADIQKTVTYWTNIAEAYAAFRGKIPELYKERSVIDRQMAAGYMFASYPVNGPFAEINNLLNPSVYEQTGAWGWLHEM